MADADELITRGFLRDELTAFRVDFQTEMRRMLHRIVICQIATIVAGTAAAVALVRTLG